ncbi:MAG: hypothetical protein HYT87_12900 [Nitrospirae bacterium]|nr:hypothetical protein [Nitrospirota bacterium]
MKQHKAVKVLSLLLKGRSVESGGRTWAMGEDHSLGVIGKDMTTGEECVLRVDLNIRGFVELCETIPDDKLFVMGAEQVLTELHAGRR